MCSWITRSPGRPLTLAGLRRLVLLGAVGGAVAGAPVAAPAQVPGAQTGEDTLACAFDTLVFDADFPGGHLDACTARADGSYELRFDPEDRPINASPWYAFRISTTRPREILVHLTYGHRYWPKLSADGERWQRAAIGAVSVAKDKAAASLRLYVGEKPLWVAGQELIDNEDYRLWAEALAGVFELSRLGRSAQGRDIIKLEHAADSRRYIALSGRQHPPEVSGALALMHFTERLAEDDELARRFRRHFGIVVIPNMNPDGVALGYWRHNTGGVDLNRDWGPFTQPVTVKPGHYPHVPTSKTYMHANFGIPAITFELGDETDREFVRRYARTAAQQMMLELLSVV